MTKKGMTPGQIDNFFVDLQTKLRNFKTEFAADFKKAVEDKTPVVTGKLKESWTTTQTSTGFNISNNQPYAGYVEFGTEHMAPRAMIGRTLVEAPQIATEVAQRLGLKK